MSGELGVKPVGFPVMTDGRREAWVRMTGKVFEIGEYRDVNFSISEEEMDLACSGFETVDLDLDHSDQVDLLGNPLGQLTRIWRVGEAVLGEIWLPEWLWELCGGSVQVSLAFSEAKQVVGCALTVAPRVADAQVRSVFSKIGDGIRKLLGADREVEHRKMPLVTEEPKGAVVSAVFNRDLLLGDTVMGDSAARLEGSSAVGRTQELLSLTDLGRACLKKEGER